MTCIVGLKHGKHVYIGADSAAVASNGVRLVVRKDEKVFKNGDFLIGFCGSFRMGQLLKYSLKIPKMDAKESFEEYMVTKFIDSIRECFKNGGFLTVEDEIEYGGTFLVGYKDKLVNIRDDHQVEIAVDDFNAVGSGEMVALGSLYSTTGNPIARVTKALEASAMYTQVVRPPFIVRSTAGGG